MQGLNLKIKTDELSRQGTSSIEAHSSEKGTLAGISAIASITSVWGCSEIEWGEAFSFEVSIFACVIWQ